MGQHARDSVFLFFSSIFFQQKLHQVYKY